MKILLKRLYTAYVALLFVLTFFLFVPVFLFAIVFKKMAKYGLLANLWWARVFFPLAFIPYEREFRFKPDKKQNYVLCANHFSYLDIPSLVWFPLPFKFMGKKSVMNIPLLGFIFQKLHIMVDREEAKSRTGSLKRAMEALDQGFSLMVFPEGGIFAKEPPKMVSFKNGAFKAAITKNVPLVPVTLPYNFLMLPDD
ncbi:MAG: lysophospholipid acyltransferase family protein, partial [Bacteroidota bacterium]